MGSRLKRIKRRSYHETDCKSACRKWHHQRLIVEQTRLRVAIWPKRSKQSPQMHINPSRGQAHDVGSQPCANCWSTEQPKLRFAKISWQCTRKSGSHTAYRSNFVQIAGPLPWHWQCPKFPGNCWKKHSSETPSLASSPKLPFERSRGSLPEDTPSSPLRPHQNCSSCTLATLAPPTRIAMDAQREMHLRRASNRTPRLSRLRGMPGAMENGPIVRASPLGAG